MTTKPAVALSALVALLGSGPCDGGPTGLKDGVVQGTWGGENAGMIADDTSAHVHLSLIHI